MSAFLANRDLIEIFDDEHGNFGAAKPYTASASLPLTRSVWPQYLDRCATSLRHRT